MAHPLTVVQEPLDGVGDLELTAGRRLDGRYRVVDPRVEEVHARPAPGSTADRPASPAVAPPRRRRPARRPRTGADPRRARGGSAPADPSVGAGPAARARLETLDELRETLLQHVVAEIHHEVVVTEEVAGDEHAVRQAERGVLRDVGDATPQLEPSPTAALISSAVSPTMMPISLMPGGGHGLDAVEEDRLVGDRDELLRARVGDGAKTGARAARQDQPLHPRSIVGGR